MTSYATDQSPHKIFHRWSVQLVQEIYAPFYNTLTNQQRNIAKGDLIDSNNKVYGIFPSFSSLHLELALGSHIINNFSDRFSFNLANKKEKDKIYFQELDEMVSILFFSIYGYCCNRC